MTGLEHALIGLQQALDAPRRRSLWRRLVRQRMAAVQDALAADLTRDGDAAFAGREQRLTNERLVLLRRFAALGSQVSDTLDVEQVRAELHRLVADVERHRQRLNDLVYDSVSMELGGSE